MKTNSVLKKLAWGLVIFIGLSNVVLAQKIQVSGKVMLAADHGVFIPCRDTRTFACRPGQQVSIINFNARNLHGLGLVYPLSDFTNWWQGTLNECTGTEFTIEAEGEYLVFLNFPQPLPQSTR